MVLGLAAVLWPLLAVFLWWALRLQRRERNRFLLILGTGAVAGILLVVLFSVPALLHGKKALSFTILFSIKHLLRYVVAAPLGALIALFLAQTPETAA